MPRMTVNQYLGLPNSWPVKERIHHNIVVVPTKRDCAKATKGDPCACALVQALKRVYGVSAAMVGGRWAYIPQVDKKGKHYIARVQATKATQRGLRGFDKTGEIPEHGFEFIPIAPSAFRSAAKVYEANRKVARGKSTQKRRHTRRAVYRALPKGLAA